MNKKIKSLFLALTSVAAGFCNALLGAGGGILLTLFMGKALKNEISDRRDLLATSQAAMIPGCALSCLIYGSAGYASTDGLALMALSAVAGGAVGSILLSKINSKWIKRIFGLLVIWSGARMIIR